MVSLLFASSIQSGAPSIRDTQAWRNYAKVVSTSVTIEVKYTVFVDDKKTETCTIRAAGPDAVSWVNPGKTRVIWNAGVGLWINDTMKVFLFFFKKSDFLASCPITIPDVIPAPGRFVNSLEASTIIEGGRELDTVRFGDQGVDTIDFSKWAFDKKTHLPIWIMRSWGGLWNRGEGNIRYQIDSFDLFARFDERVFALEPPQGYHQLGEL